MVAVQSLFSIQEVNFVMGNHIAGGKVRPVLEVVDTPELNPSKGQVLPRGDSWE